MRGFVLTTDSIVALVLTTSIIIMVNSSFMRVNESAWNDAQVERVSMDSLAVLEKSGALGRAVQQNSSAELLYIMSTENTPLCMVLNMSGGNGYNLSVEKSRCGSESGKVFLSRRTFVAGNNFYTAELQSWEG